MGAAEARASQRAVQARVEKTARLVEAGDLVPNKVFRERVEFLQAHDPHFALTTVCLRLADLGYPKFLKRPSGTSKGRSWMGDTSHLERLLGMRDPAPTFRNGRRYTAPHRTEFIRYEFAAALCRALDMWPTDCGV